MKSKYTAHYSLLLVLLVHIGVLAAVFFAPESLPPIEVVPPAIQGVIVAAPLEKPPEPLPIPPPPEQKPLPQPKPKIPLPKAPPSERAVKQEVAQEPAPPPPVEEAPVVQQAPVIPPRVDASQSNNPAPVYPAASRRLREQGIVLLEVLVQADGSIGELRLKKTSGYDRLDESALRAVKQWHFTAAKRGDEAIDYWYELPIEFSLNN